MVDAPAVRSFNDGFDDGGSGQTIHYVQALSGGTVKLPGLSYVTTPVRAKDSLQFNLSAGTIDMSGPHQVSGAGRITFTTSGLGSLLSATLQRPPP